MRWIPVALMAAACGGAGADSPWLGTISDSAGIQIVRNPATGMWAPDQVWTLAEELRIGTAEGDADYQFGNILPAGSIAIASDGRIVVLDAQGQHLKVFTPDGKYERTIGGPGAGPGEIGQAAQGIAVLIAPGDTVFVADGGNQRVSLYAMDGTFVRSFPLTLAEGFALRWESTTDGRILAQMRRVGFPGSTTQPDSMDAIAVRKLDGSVGDTLMKVPSGKSFSFTGGAPEWNMFVPEPVWALWADRFLYAVNNQYRIGVHGAEGRLERVFEKPFSLAPVTEGDQQTMLNGFRKIFKSQGVPPQFEPQLLARVHFAPTYPAFVQMLAGPDGSILVQLIHPISALSAEEQEAFDLLGGALGSRQWDVFDREGRFLGTVEMPLRFQPVRFIGDRIYGIQRDELDVQYVVVLNVVKGGGAAGEG
jgi:hypothetical protein